MTNPLDVQIAGSHYKTKKIQPVEYISANNLNFLEGCIVKRITRWRDKNGIQDLEKIKHEVDLLIEMERRYGSLAEQPKTPSVPDVQALHTEPAARGDGAVLRKAEKLWPRN